MTVQQVKIFKGLESDVPALEAEINAWIHQSGIKVLSITGNIAPQSQPPGDKKGPSLQSGPAASDVVLVVLYETR